MDGGGVIGLILGLPEAPTVLFAVCLALILGYMLLRSYTKTLTVEVDGLRSSLKDQSNRHREDMERLDDQMAALQAENREQHSIKHAIGQDAAKLVVALDLVQRLARECVCDRQPLAPLEEIIDRLLNEQLEAIPHRRSTRTSEAT